MFRFLRSDSFDNTDSPVALSSLVPAAGGTGNTGAVRFVIDVPASATASAHLVPTSSATVGVELKADAQYEVGPFAWPGSVPHVYLPSGAACVVNTFVSNVAP